MQTKLLVAVSTGYEHIVGLMRQEFPIGIALCNVGVHESLQAQSLSSLPRRIVSSLAKTWRPDDNMLSPTRGPQHDCVAYLRIGIQCTRRALAAISIHRLLRVEMVFSTLIIPSYFFQQLQTRCLPNC